MPLAHPPTDSSVPPCPTAPADALAALRQKIDQFSEVRNWGRYHTPKNLSMALSVEASELLEHFQWQDGHERFADLPAAQQQAVAHEVADVFIYLLRFCSVTGIDPVAAAEEKIVLNALKYPVDGGQGHAGKDTDG